MLTEFAEQYLVRDAERSLIPYFETIRVWYPALLENQFIGHLVGIPLLIGPPILALLWPHAPAKNAEV